MPPAETLVVALLLLIPPCFMIAIVTLDTQTRPYRRTKRALGAGLIAKATSAGLLSMVGFAVTPSSVYLAPLAIFGASIFATIRILHVSTWQPPLVK